MQNMLLSIDVRAVLMGLADATEVRPARASLRGHRCIALSLFLHYSTPHSECSVRSYTHSAGGRCPPLLTQPPLPSMGASATGALLLRFHLSHEA
eukprot:6374724-Prymnesium_polylepis.1